ncbi:hypothetical protein NpPPO83_00005320 [Neofusicoccum parvum]|uniref:Uncharacterized protein n=1 Tax=Neofusicoccum parvum TaxID=310453 RepID=A0ACB5S688_9PEZI|nr:hypothetical protein NpPPO83_00005320 [Neofusicoccum parvum]
MPSVAGQTALMRLRTALAATPTPRAAAKAASLAAGKENAVPASPLRVRPARPALRSLERCDTSSPAPRVRKRKVGGEDGEEEGWEEDSPSKRARRSAPAVALGGRMLDAEGEGDGGDRVAVARWAEEMQRRRTTSSSVVGEMPDFPGEYFFGGLGEALVDLAPFMGVGGKKRKSSTEAEGTIVKMARKEEGEESEVTVAGGSELVQKWVEGLPSPKG